MSNFLRLAEVRGSIGILANQGSESGTFILLHAIQGAVMELGVISKRLLRPAPKKKQPLPIIDIEVVETVEVKKPTVEARQAAVAVRRPSATSAYHADRYLPYRILWVKVIIRAMYDYALWKDSKDMRLRNFAKDAERWLFQPSDLELSFENICNSFDFPIEKIRAKSRILTRQDVKNLEHRERQGRPETLVEAGGESR